MENGGIDYEISPDILAEWIEHQGADQWWRVDGDPILTGLLSFPCPGDELAAQLRSITRPLVVHGRDESVRGKLTWGDLGALAEPLVVTERDGRAEGHDRALALRWDASGDEWLLIEDEDATEFYRREAAGQGKDS